MTRNMYWLPLVLVIGLACDPPIGDDFGPSSGFARVEGRVVGAEGRPKVRYEVLLTLCDAPIDGFAGEDLTDDEGAFSILSALPPVGFLPRSTVFPVQVTCTLVVDRVVTSAEVQVPFFERRDLVVPVRVDVRIDPDASGP